MKYYEGGKPIYESADKEEKREGFVVLRRAETKVADGQREGPAVNRTRFKDLIEGLKNDYLLKRLKTWKLREQHLAHLSQFLEACERRRSRHPNFKPTWPSG